MMRYNLSLTVECKNKKSIFYFSLLFLKLFNSILIKHKKAFKNVSKFAILRSPHVHKSSQHEFQQRLFVKNFLFCMLNTETIVFFKKLFFNFFHDIRKKFNFVVSSKSSLFFDFKCVSVNLIADLMKNTTNDTNISILDQSKNEFYNKKLKNYLKILNLIGKSDIVK